MADASTRSICLRGAVHQLQPPLPIDDEHAFDHAGEDRFHARAIARELLEPAPEFLHGLVERARDGAELVGAVVVDRAREVAGANSARRLAAIALTRRDSERREEPATRAARAESTTASAASVARTTAAAARRRRSAARPDGRTRRSRMRCTDGDVQHVGADRRAVPLAAADARARARRHFRPLSVVLERRQRPRVCVGVADDAAVLGDERDARRNQLAESIGFVVEGRFGVERGCLREQLGR